MEKSTKGEVAVELPVTKSGLIYLLYGLAEFYRLPIDNQADRVNLVDDRWDDPTLIKVYLTSEGHTTSVFTHKSVHEEIKRIFETEV